MSGVGRQGARFVFSTAKKAVDMSSRSSRTYTVDLAYSRSGRGRLGMDKIKLKLEGWDGDGGAGSAVMDDWAVAPMSPVVR